MTVMSRIHARVAIVCALVAGVLTSCAERDEPNTVAGAAAPPAADVAELALRVGDAVWRVDTEGCGWLGSGSAFAIDRRHLVTNRHVTANDTSPTVRSRSGRQLRGRVIGATGDPDVAVIRVDEDLPVTVDWASTPSLVERESLVIFGYPRPEKSFRATSGSIVSFQGGREAALSDAPVERGNSGGPAVRADASVAGVVTRMSLGGDERVAIIFTADEVRRTVEGFVARPADVLSDCGLGPDYVPPVPERYNVTAVPPPPAPAVRLDVPATTTVTEPPAVAAAPPTPAPVRTTSTIPCPSGRAIPRPHDVTKEPGQDGSWAVTVDGTIRNDGTSSVTFEFVDVVISGEPPKEVLGYPEAKTLAPGASTRWHAEGGVYSPDREPTVTATLEWRWSDERYSSCPSH